MVWDTSYRSDSRTAARICHYKPSDYQLPCPAFSTISPGTLCTKKGGVCSIRKYKALEDGTVVCADNKIATVCPSRLLEDANVLKWAGKIVLQSDTPYLVKEVPFLEKLKVRDSDESDDESKKAGRIDWLLVDSDLTQLRWCAIETQSVYFSGKEMAHEFKLYLDANNTNIIFPTETRRPDYRSSGPKRLAPQLQVKVPELRKWGKKTVVIVDRYFFDNMSDLPEVPIKGNREEDKLGVSEIVWLIIDYDTVTGKLFLYNHLYTELDPSIKALNATRAIAINDFENNLVKLLSEPKRLGKKYFKPW